MTNTMDPTGGGNRTEDKDASAVCNDPSEPTEATCTARGAGAAIASESESTKTKEDARTGDINDTAATLLEAAPEKRAGRPPGGAKDKKRRRKVFLGKGAGFIDLTGVPPQPSILKNEIRYRDNTRRRTVKESSSKYMGVYYDGKQDKWKAQIMVEGKVRSIGYYDSEEAAAAEYARAAFKYKSAAAPEDQTYGGMDLSDVPEQGLITSSSASGYRGVKKNKARWEARIGMGGKEGTRSLGTFDTPDAAAGIYARAAFNLEQRRRGRAKGRKSVQTMPPLADTAIGTKDDDSVTQGKDNTTVHTSTSTRKREFVDVISSPRGDDADDDDPVYIATC